MGRDYFQFKQFLVEQKKSAMKVGTDGVLLGAWVSVPFDPLCVLDVGSGTGLLALMMAQRFSKAYIHGVELDEDACKEAQGNFVRSEWGNRLKAIHSSFQQYVAGSDDRYDMIVCNPPFFSTGLKNPVPQRALARHNDSLEPSVLLSGCKVLMKPMGWLALILPLSEYEEFQMLAAREGWFEQKRTLVKPRPQKRVKRVLSAWALKQNPNFLTDELVIHERVNVYSPAFRALTQAFYLDKEK